MVLCRVVSCADLALAGFPARCRVVMLALVREIAEPFVVDAPSGAAMTTRLRVTAEEHAVLADVGAFLGRLRTADLKRVCDWETKVGGSVSKKERSKERSEERNARKTAMTGVSSARIAGSIVRANDAEWELAWRNLWEHRGTLVSQIRTLSKRTALSPGERDGKNRGYRTAHERAQKRRRLQICKGRLRRVQRRIDERRPGICVGGKARARLRHNLGAAHMSKAAWRADWDAARWFLSFAGETGKRHGNDTLHVDPATGTVELNLPAKLAHHANVTGRQRRLFRFSTPVRFDDTHPGWATWAERAHANKSMRYELRWRPEAKRGKGAWYLTVTWAQQATPAPDIESLRSHPTLGVDLNAGWIAAVAVDADGNPTGRPFTAVTPQQGPKERRDGQMRAAVQQLLDIAAERGCASISVEDLGFDDMRATGRETMGRGPKGKQFRRKSSNIPTAKFKAALAAMAARRGIAVIAVDPAYTSKWAAQHKWRQPVNCSDHHPCSSHHAAAVVIGRRGLGMTARRSRPKQRMRSCRCPLRHPAQGPATTRPIGMPSRSNGKRPPTTQRHPRPAKADKTRTAERGNSPKRNATPFGVAPRDPPVATGRIATNKTL